MWNDPLIPAAAAVIGKDLDRQQRLAMTAMALVIPGPLGLAPALIALRRKRMAKVEAPPVVVEAPPVVVEAPPVKGGKDDQQIAALAKSIAAIDSKIDGIADNLSALDRRVSVLENPNGPPKKGQTGL